MNCWRRFDGRIARRRATALGRSTSGFGPATGAGKPKKPGGNTIRAKWMNAEGAVYTGMLASVLYELDIVSIGYQVPSTVVDAGQVFNPDAFMVTELGAAVLAEKTSPTPSRTTAPAFSAVKVARIALAV